MWLGFPVEVELFWDWTMKTGEASIVTMRGPLASDLQSQTPRGQTICHGQLQGPMGVLRDSRPALPGSPRLNGTHRPLYFTAAPQDTLVPRGLFQAFLHVLYLLALWPGYPPQSPWGSQRQTELEPGSVVTNRLVLGRPW